MNKRLRSTLLACAWAGVAAPALADGFTGPADPSAFVIANLGTLTGSAPTLGTATFSPIQLVLVGANSVSPGANEPGCSGGVYSVLGPCRLTVTLAQAGTYSFDWSYVTADPDGPAGDIFGVLVDGAPIMLSDLGGAVAQTGSASFVATSSFGWFMDCTDCINGFANATVSGFNVTVVPEPATPVLMLAGALAVAAATRRRFTTPR